MNAPLRILHAAKSLGLGGTEKVMQLFAAGLDRSRFEPHVFSFVDGPRGALMRQQSVPTHIGHDFLQVLERVQPHIVHVHRAGWPEKDLLAPVKRYRSARGASLPGVVETNVFGRHDPTPLGRMVHRRLFVSRFCLERYAVLYDSAAGPPGCGYLYNPVDTDFFAAHGADPAGAGPVIGRLSRPDPGKWSPLALEFLPYLADRVPDFLYLIVGGVDWAEQWVRDKGFVDKVRFLPPMETDAELADFFARLRVLAHANGTGESFGLAIAEAMAAGLPVVTHPSPWPKDNAQAELVDHGVTGFMAADPAAYAARTAELLQKPGLAAAMGQAGQKKAVSLYRLQNVVQKLEGIYEELAGELSSAGENSG